MYKSKQTCKYKFVAKVLKYRILFKDILTFLGLDCRDVSCALFMTHLFFNTFKTWEQSPSKSY